MTITPSIATLVARSIELVLAAWPFVVACGGLAWLVVRFDERVLAKRISPRVLPASMLAIAISVGLYRSISTAWLADDAFISFRYARNLATGHGLVWNLGERVEGYTNFLFTVALAAVARLGGDIPWTALLLDLLAYLSIIYLAVQIPAATVHRPGLRSSIPAAAVFLALSRPLCVFATSGLETLVASAFALGSLALLVQRRHPAFVGLALALAAMTRPDHALLLAGAVASYAVAEDQPRERLQRIATVCAAFLLLFGSYWIARWNYYGDFVPNTFRAKSGGRFYWSQGFVYLAHFVTTTWSFLLIGAGIALAVLRRRAPTTNLRIIRAYTCTGGGLLALYVTAIGGDFMEFRFLITAFVLAVVWLDAEHRSFGTDDGRTSDSRAWRMAALALALVGAIQIRPLEPLEKLDGIADEPSFYPIERESGSWWIPRGPLHVVSTYEDWASRLLSAFPPEGPKPRMACGAIGILGYRTDFPIFDVLGLTDRVVATRRIARRGRPGHERMATLQEAVDSGSWFWLGAPQLDDAPSLTVQPGGVRALLLSVNPGHLTAIASAQGAPIDLRAIAGSVATVASRDVRVREAAILRRVVDSSPIRSELVEILNNSLGSVREFEGEVGASVAGTTGRIVSSTDLPGLQGASALRIRGATTYEISIPPGSVELRGRIAQAGHCDFSLAVCPVGSTTSCELASSSASGARAHPFSIRWREASARVVFRVQTNSPECDVFLDSVHVPPRTERVGDFGDAAYSDCGQVLAMIQRTSDDVPATDERRRRLLERATFAELFESDDGFAHDARYRASGYRVTHETRLAGLGALVRGVEGAGYLTSADGERRENAQFSLELGRIESEAYLSLRMAAGSDCSRSHVEISNGSGFVARLCGHGNTVLEQQIVSLPRSPDRSWTIRAIDSSAAPGDFVVLDQIVLVPVTCSLR